MSSDDRSPARSERPIPYDASFKAAPATKRGWISIPFLLISVIVPSAFATQQMGFIRNRGPDLHEAGAAICVVGALLGLIALIRMAKRGSRDRHAKTSLFVTLAGTLIFMVGAIVIATTTDQSPPRVSGTQPAAG